MSEQRGRPRDVVSAATLTITGSATVLVVLFTRAGDVRSADTRREIESALADPRFDGLDVTVTQVLNLLNGLVLLLAAASATAIVLSIYVLRKHRPSRIALTALGAMMVLLSVAGGVVGVLFGLFVAYAIWLLWKPASRAWFREEPMSGDTPSEGRSDEPRPDAARPDEQPSGSAASESGSDRPQFASAAEEAADEARSGHAPPDEPTRPGPYAGYGQPTGGYPQQPSSGSEEQYGAPQQQYGASQQPHGASQQPPYGQGGYGQPAPYGPQQAPYGQPPAPYGQPMPHGYSQGMPSGPPYPGGPNRRPGVVVGALVMTWIGVAFMLLVGLGCLVFAGNRDVLDTFESELQTQGVAIDDLATILRVVGLVLIGIAVLVGVISIFAWRRANWARIALTVIGAAYCMLQFFALLTGALTVVFAIVYVAIAIVLLWLPAARNWYAARSFPSGYGGYGAGGPGHGGSGGPGQQHPW